MDIINSLRAKLLDLYHQYSVLLKRLLTFFVLPVGAFAVLFAVFRVFDINIINSIQYFFLSLNLSFTRFLLFLFDFRVITGETFGMFQIVDREAVLIGAPAVGFRYFFISLLVITICTNKTKNILINYFVFLFLIYLLSVFYSTLKVVYPEFFTKYFFSLFFEGTMVLLLMYFPLKNISPFKKRTKIEQAGNSNSLSMSQINEKINLYHYVFIGLVLLLIFVFVRFNKPIEGISRLELFITNLILYPAKFFLDLLGYSPEVNFRDIKGDNAWIFVGIPCLGKRIMLVFAAFVLLFKGGFLNKLLYIGLGLLVILFFNAWRIALLYMYLDKHGSIYWGSLNLHDAYNYIVYAAVVGLWLLYLKYFTEKTYLIR